MPFGDGTLNLSNGGLHRRNRHDTLRNEALTFAGPLLNQPVIVCLHTSQLELGVFNPTKCLTRHSGYGRIQNRAIHSIRIHGLETFIGLIGYLRHILPALGLVGSIGQHGTHRSDPREGILPPVHDPML
jgi:hypothetical protein